jgi:hypothetical protein
MTPTSELVVTVGGGNVARRPRETRAGTAGPAPQAPAGQHVGSTADENAPNAGPRKDAPR